MESELKNKILNIINNDKKKDTLGHISIHQARELLMDAGSILLDVRPPARVEGENAQEAGIVNAFYTPYPSFFDYLDILPKDKNSFIVLGCLKGWFANRVMGYLEMEGYTNIFVLDTSIADLIEAHYAHTNK